MKVNKPFIVLMVSLGLSLCSASFNRSSVAAESANSTATSDNHRIRDQYQRSLEVYEFTRAAKSGPERGAEIYYYKCWYCHNEYTTGAPRLDELQKGGKLASGDPINSKTVTAKIREGSPIMPSYRGSLTDADLKDLVSYLLSGKCCFDSNNPPPNPRYRVK